MFRGLWIALAVFILLVDADNYHQCFKRVTRRSIGNYAPIAEYRKTALSMCSQHCIMAAGNGPQGTSICKAFTYEVQKQLCKLYDNDGHKVPAVIHPIIGIDIFYRTSDTKDCGGPLASGSLNPNFVKLNSNKASLKSSIAKTDSINVDQFMQKTRALSAPIMRMENMDEVLRSKLRGEDNLVPMAATSSEKRENLKDIVAPLKCETSSGYYVVIGNEIVMPISGGGDVKVYNDVEQGDCAKYCGENKGPDSVHIDCKSLNYFPADRKCELYSILAEPHGTGRLLENEKVIYAEKFCLPDSLSKCQKDEIFILHVQKTLRAESKIAEKSAKSITECLKHCLSNKQCQGSVFVSDKKSCELFDDASRVDDAGEETVLIENGCIGGYQKTSSSRETSRNNREEERSDEEGWSGCDYKIGGKDVRVRTNDDGEMETQEC
ncbi:unnamed protein product [Caenorhabditis angaria]|uniref:Apple domain-containing protein n=1 Tax=Caenorhabditis angaria TaxID=860376 RepID=A0A9P1J1M5_9PELO|nr:unnamed protein product [Caenorhabditis angaria]